MSGRRLVKPLAAVVAILALIAGAGAVLAVATAGTPTVTLNEDDASVAIDLTGTTDTGASSVTYTVTVDPTHGTIDEGTGATGTMACVAGDCSATIHYTPTANYFGSDSLTYVVTDSDGNSNPAGTVSITVNAVNDAPSFTKGADVPVLEDSGAYSAAWATSISPGPGEDTQSVTFDISSNDNAGLFAAGPAVASDGTLTFTPAPDAFGVATIGVTAHDDGGTANGGVDASAEQTFTITVTGVNDQPSFSPGPNEVVNHDSGAFTAVAWAKNITPGPTNESAQAVSFSFTANDNTALFTAGPAVDASGTLTFTVKAGTFGTANLTLVAIDDGGTANGGIDTSPGVPVVIRVNANPNAINDTVTVAENSGANVLNVLANDTSLPDPPETLTITGVSSGIVLGPLHGTASVSAAGTRVTYTPTPGYYGSDFLRYFIADPYGGTDYADVFVTIAKDTTPPVVTSVAQGFRTGASASSTSLPGRVSWSGTDGGVGISSYQIQRSINGGTYTYLSLPTPTATSLSVSYAPGSTSYRFRVRAIDRNGNVGAFTYSPLFHDATYQETNAYIHYGGTWYRAYTSYDYGGAANYTSVAGRYAYMTRSFRDIAFVAPRSSGRGSVYVYVDGVRVATVSLRYATTQYRMVLWTRHYSSVATHTIKIVVVGNVRVDLDAFITLY